MASLAKNSFATISSDIFSEGGRNISYLRSGSGPCIVLLHGIGSAARSWQAQLQGLSTAYDVIAWDAPGYGGSTHLPGDAPDVDAYAQTLATFMQGLNVGRCHLVGHSLGSLIAARFARIYADRLLSLTLASCALGHASYAAGDRERLLRLRLDDVRTLGMAGMAAKRGPRLLSAHASPSMLHAVIDAMSQADPAGYRQAARMLSGGDMLEDIAAIDASLPIQIVYGLDDVITPPEANERAAGARNDIQVVRIARAGHIVYVEQAAAFNQAIVDFAETADAQS